MTKFTLDEAKDRLRKASREQLSDRAFGDQEVYWFIDGHSVAGGYFGRTASVGLDATADREATEFHGVDADALHYLGNLTLSEWNE